MLCSREKWLKWLFYNRNEMCMYLKTMLLVKTANKALQLTQKAPFVLCIALRSIIAQNKGHFSVN